ncbi:MAG: DUF1588 domain-containing protein [Planctomycetota bacterium]
MSAHRSSSTAVRRSQRYLAWLPLIAFAMVWTEIVAGGLVSRTAAAANPREFFARHCGACHDDQSKEAGFSFQKIAAFGDAAPDTWAAVRDQLQLRLMPPAKEPQPTDAERRAVVDWIADSLRSAGHYVDNKLAWPNFANYVPHGDLFGKEPHPAPATSVRVWRKRPGVYAAKFPRAVQPFSMLPRQQISDYGIAYAVDESATEILVRNATQVVKQWTNVELRDGVVQPVKGVAVPSWSLPLLRSDRGPTPEEFAAGVQQAYQFALERPAKDDELVSLRELYDRVAEAHGRLQAGRGVLLAPLLLPESMFRVELGAGPLDSHGRRRLSRAEILTGLEYTLFDGQPASTLPSALQQAKKDASAELATRAEVAALVKNILGGDSPGVAANKRVLAFFDEYFDYRKAVDVFQARVPQNLPQNPHALVWATERLIARIVEEDRDVLRRLLTDNTTFVYVQPRAPQVHRLYNLPADFKYREDQLLKHPPGAVTPVELPPEQRSGILTEPSWLVAHSTNFETDPVRRGKWVLEHLLGGTVPEIPVTVCANIPEDNAKTLRERFKLVSENAYCWQCHDRMNQLGMPFEAYDRFGRYRLRELHRPVDTTGAIVRSGEPALDGPVPHPVEMLHRLARSPRPQQMFVRYAFRYFLGRNETVRDARTLQEAESAYVMAGGSFKALVVSLLSSDSFLYRTMDP